jgi:hypothetical protein
MRLYWLLAVIPFACWYWNARRNARSDARMLIESVVKNSEANLGYKPDAASLVFLATHPFLSARIWGMLCKGGASALCGGPVDEACDLACNRLLPHVRDATFRAQCPCAAALMQYAIYLCDCTDTQRYGWAHPKDELERTGEQ